MFEYIERYLDAYRKDASADYAVMLTGHWGCGKTYFINEYLEHHCKDGDGESEGFYVSLNGVKTKGDVLREIFARTNPALGGKIASGLGKAVMFAAHALGRFEGLESSVLSETVAAFSKLNGKLLVLDDLERCEIPLSELFGYISHFISEGAHIILVCCEMELQKRQGAEDKGQEYKNIKEKVVGKTFELPADITAVYDALSDEKQFPAIAQILKDIKEDVIWDFNQVDAKYNYRALKNTFRDLNYWFDLFDEKIRITKAFAYRFARIYIALSYEKEVGNLTEEIFGRIHLASSDKEQDTPYEKILRRHNIQLVNPWIGLLKTLIVSDDCFQRMLFARKISIAEVQDEVFSSEYFISPTKSNEWQKLMRWDVLPSAMVKELLAVVETKLKGCKYTIPEEILHISCLQCHLSSYGIIKKTHDKIIRDTEKYVKKLMAEHKLAPMQNRNNSMELADSWGGFGYIGEFDGMPWYSDLRNIIRSAGMLRRQLELHDEIRQSFPGGLDDTTGRFICRIKPTGEWGTLAVFQFVSPRKFVSAFSKLENQDKRTFGELLNSRYAIASKNLLEDERPFWSKVAAILSHKALRTARSGNPDTHQIKILYNFINGKWELGIKPARMSS